MIDWYPLVIGFLFGCFIGSFLNVCVHRLPRNESVVVPGSRCYSCGTWVQWYDNLPVISWLVLRGRCRFCGSRFSVRYLVGELAVGLLAAGLLWWAWQYPRTPLPTAEAHQLAPLAVAPGIDLFTILFGRVDGLALFADGASWPAAAGAVVILALAFLVWVASRIDLDHTIIPDELTLPLQVVAPVLALAIPVAVAPTTFWPSDWWLWVEPLGRHARIDCWQGFWSSAAWAVPAIVALPLSLPLARWIYGRCAQSGQVWRAEDHQAFGRAVWFFTWVSAGHLLLALGLTLLAAGDAAAWQALQMQFCVALLGSLAGWWSLYLIGLVGTGLLRRNAMGFGDVKLLAPLGAVLGPWGVVVTFFAAALLGTIVGLPQRLLGRGREIPFGPFLACGALIALVAGGTVADWFAQLYG